MNDKLNQKEGEYWEDVLSRFKAGIEKILEDKGLNKFDLEYSKGLDGGELFHSRTMCLCLKIDEKSTVFFELYCAEEAWEDNERDPEKPCIDGIRKILQNQEIIPRKYGACAQYYRVIIRGGERSSVKRIARPGCEKGNCEQCPKDGRPSQT